MAGEVVAGTLGGKAFDDFVARSDKALNDIKAEAEAEKRRRWIEDSWKGWR